MHKKQISVFYPCNGRCLGISIPNFFLSIVLFATALSLEKNDVKTIFTVISFLLILLNIVFIVLFGYKWNSCVYIDEEKMVQKQFNHLKIIKFDEIDDVKLSHAYYAKVPPLITIYGNNDKIFFEITSKVLDEFVNNSSNSVINDKLEKLLKDNYIF